VKLAFSVPAHFSDFDYLNRLAALNENHAAYAKVVEVYGAAPESFGMHARHNIQNNYTNAFEEFSKYVENAHRQGISVNIALNTPLIKKWNRKKETVRLQALKNTGVDAFTIADPRLLLTAALEVPQCERILSTIADIHGLRALQHWAVFDFNRVVPRCDLNRNPNVLRNLVVNGNKDIEIIVNLDCLPQCGISNFHYAETAVREASSKGSICRDFCSAARLKYPAEFLKAPWILPEDCRHYAELGIRRFKIVGREFPSKDLLRIISAYLKSKFDGNLLDLLRPLSRQTFTVNEMHLNVYISTMELRARRFMDFFWGNKCRFECNQCSYCEQFTDLISMTGNASPENIAQALKERNIG